MKDITFSFPIPLSLNEGSAVEEGGGGGGWVGGKIGAQGKMRRFHHQAPVVQRADNFIQRISCCPADKMY